MEVLTWCSIPSPMVIDALHLPGINGVIIDIEHGIINWETIANFAYQNHIVCVRINYPIDEREINYAMELGIKGIFVPHVETNNTVIKIENIVAHKGLSPYTKCLRYGQDLDPKFIQKQIISVQNYFEVIYMIEGEGIHNAEKIFYDVAAYSFNKIRAVYIGIYDLSKYLGVTGDLVNKEVVSTMVNLITISKKYKVKIGTYARNADDAKFWKQLGVDFIAMGSDIGYMVAKYQDELRRL